MARLEVTLDLAELLVFIMLGMIDMTLCTGVVFWLLAVGRHGKLEGVEGRSGAEREVFGSEAEKKEGSNRVEIPFSPEMWHKVRALGFQARNSKKKVIGENDWSAGWDDTVHSSEEPLD